MTEGRRDRETKAISAVGMSRIFMPGAIFWMGALLAFWVSSVVASPRVAMASARELYLLEWRVFILSSIEYWDASERIFLTIDRFNGLSICRDDVDFVSFYFWVEKFPNDFFVAINFEDLGHLRIGLAIRADYGIAIG